MPAFSRSADFAIDKPAGQPCVNLLADHRCTIHDTLRDKGFAGCTVYDCFGAGQHVVQQTFGGRSWQDSPEVAAAMFPAYRRMRDLHELLWYLADALGRPETEPVHDALLAAQSRITALTDLDADAAGRRRQRGLPARGGPGAHPGQRARPRARRVVRPSAGAPTWSVATCPAPTCRARTCAAPT